MKVRVRHPNGQTVLTFGDNDALGLLTKSITDVAGFASFDLNYGYPPKPLKIDHLPRNTKLSDLSVSLNGEQIIVSPAFNASGSQGKESQQKTGEVVTRQSGMSSKTSAIQKSSSSTKRQGALSGNPLSSPSDPPEIALPHHGGVLILRIMPDDNSCLFRAFNSAFFGLMDNMHELRSIIAQEIQADPETYSAAVLDQPVDDYCRWIQSEEAWGGSIELDILSKHFNIEICSIDVQTLRVDRYNEGQATRCILIYSGIHYDVIALSTSPIPEGDIKVFENGASDILHSSVSLCRQLREQHYFTDTAKFNVKCNTCNTLVNGERGVSEHATRTGHTAFGEAF